MDSQGIKFCPECSNMLYPIELPEEKKLAFECKSCKYKQVVDVPNPASCCISSQEVGQGKALFMIDPELCLDRTLSRTRGTTCPECGNNEAVFFQNPSPTGEVEMSLIFICCGRKPDGQLCGKNWIQGPHRAK